MYESGFSEDMVRQVSSIEMREEVLNTLDLGLYMMSTTLRVKDMDGWLETADAEPMWRRRSPASPACLRLCICFLTDGTVLGVSPCCRKVLMSFRHIKPAVNNVACRAAATVP